MAETAGAFRFSFSYKVLGLPVLYNESSVLYFVIFFKAYIFVKNHDKIDKNDTIAREDFMQKILLIEDDYELNQALCYALNKEHYKVSSALSLAEAKSLYAETVPDLLLLDVNLPDGEGFAFCRWVKEQDDIPVLFLTARDLEEDALTGFDSGAEDYVTKPFSMKILLKKIDLIMKRVVKEKTFAFDDGYLSIDLDNAKVTVQGKECPVTPTELRLLKQFVVNKGHLLTYNVLLERLWDSGGQFVDKHTLAVNVNRLRGKIEDEEHKYISNVYGMGYQWIG